MSDATTTTSTTTTTDAAAAVAASSAAADAPAAPKKNHRKQNRTVLEECEEALAQSMLVFLLADLRLLSATGRVETRYETLAIASDPPARSTSADLAGLVVDTDNNTNNASQDDGAAAAVVHNQREGLSPAQIMAVVMIELTKTVGARRQREEQRESGLPNEESSAEQEEEALKDWELDPKTGTLKIRADGDDMHSLLLAYAELIGCDLKTTPTHIEKRRSLLNLNNPQDLQADLEAIREEGEGEEEGDSDDNGDMEEGGEDDGAGNNEPLGQQAAQAAGKFAEETKEKVQKPLRRAEAKRKSLMRGDQARANAHFGELTDALYKQGVGSRSLRTSLAQSLGSTQRRRTTFKPEELTDFVEKAVRSRVYGKLDFLADFFKDGTVSKFMAESKSRVVWMNDWYPLKDLTYAIAVNPEIRRVLVVFRGAITSEDWSRAVQSRNFIEVPNPIGEDYEGKSDTINMAVGFYQYLFRVRKDTGTKKYDEIANLAYKYGRERIGDDFELVLNGHSLGGALSTVFAFYASADERFTRNGPVKCFNFGAPYVGGNRFVSAFLHQERRQLLMFARFFNHNDIGKRKHYVL